MITANYLNGNYIVFQGRDGSIRKRALRNNEEFHADFPDSIDLKISNCCSIGCPWCHESSNSSGKLADIDETINILSQLPRRPIEIAVGGGDLLEHPDHTIEILKRIHDDLGLNPRITINLKSIEKYNTTNRLDRVYNCLGDDYSLPIGVSINSLPPDLPKNKYDSRDWVVKEFGFDNIFSLNLVIHIIAGVFPSSDLKKFCNSFGNLSSGILILGYKQWGRAKNNPLPEQEIKNLSNEVSDILRENEKTGANMSLVFDNLAIEQLGVREMVSKSTWEHSYLGAEFTSSMYIDAVEGKFAKTSRSEERVDWNSIGLLEYFKHDKISY